MCTCRNCGNEFEAAKASQEFCSTQCRKDFNNRRQTRGLLMYDMVMEKRFNRDKQFKQGELQTMIDTLASVFHQEDLEAGRTGTMGWRNPKLWLDANPWFKSLRATFHNIAGTKRKAA